LSAKAERRFQPPISATEKHLTVIGAGPKAVALAAKHHVLGRNGLPIPELAVYEQSNLAAHWAGDDGYTSGDLQLGTPPEKDVGFPYLSKETGVPTRDKKINAEMLDFSWAAFNIQDENRNFAEWIDRGRPNPPHRVWAAYLRWVGERVQMPLRRGALTTIGIDDSRWRLGFDSGEEVLTDGLVMTGPGPPQERIPVSGCHENVFDGKSYWSEECSGRVRACAEVGGRAAVIGSGETAAAIVVHLAECSPQFEIDVISRDGIVYTRGESFEENRLFSDPAAWESFPREVRKKFVGRTDHGVFSVANKTILNNREHVATLAGSVAAINSADGRSIRLDLDQPRLGKTSLGPYQLVVDATGFDRCWFLKLMDGDSQGRLADALGVMTATAPACVPEIDTSRRILSKDDRRLEASIGADMAVAGLYPRLHLPIFAGIEQGPGFPALGCLGTLSDRILRPYWQPDDSGA
jgi:mycobactin lysine-N-oxygenase